MSAPRAGAGRAARLLVVVLLALVTACDVGPKEPRPTPPGSTGPDRAARSRALLELQVSSDEGPGCIAGVAEQGVALWQDARGLADLGAGAPIVAGTAFELASVSKQFTALAILLLEDDGRLSTADRLSRHLDGLPTWADRVTLGQLMDHTSGVPDYFLERLAGDPTAAVGRAEVLRQIAASRRLDFAPESRWAYSNSGYVLLAEVIETVSGQPYPAFLRSRVFEPLGLSMVASAGPATPGLAPSYERTASGFAPGGWHFYAMGAVGVRATAGDLLRWADDYRTGTVGGAALLERQWDDAPITTVESSRAGAGMFRLPDGTLYNDGFYGGYRSGFLVSPDRRRAAVVLCNRTADIKPFGVLTSLARVWEFS